MTIAAISLAVLALVLALASFAKRAAFERRIEEVELGAKRRTDNLAEELQAALSTQRELLARVAGGAELTREMILEGRLWRDVDGGEAQALVAAGARVLDVRSPRETQHGVVPGAFLVPIETLEARLGELPKDRRAWVVYCAAGARSAAACELLSASGFAELHNLAGGIGAWKGPLASPAG